MKVITVGPGYNDTGLRDIASIESDILWHQNIPLLTTILGYNYVVHIEAKCSVPFMTP
jgi:hypothetical protein